MSRFNNIILKIGILGFIYFLIVGTASSQPASSISSGGDLSITADKMQFSNKDQKVTFDDHVVVMKGDMMMWADHVEILLLEGGPSQGTQSGSRALLSGTILNDDAVSEVRAWGNVRLVQGGKEAEAKEAIYERRTDRVIFMGDPILTEEGYRVTGSRMILYLNENRSVVENSRVLIQPGESGNHPLE